MVPWSVKIQGPQGVLVQWQVLDEKGNFKDENFAKLRSEAAPEPVEGDDAPSTSGRGASENGGGRGGRGRGRGCVSPSHQSMETLSGSKVDDMSCAAAASCIQH